MANRLQPRRWLEFVLEPFPDDGSPSAAVTYRWSTRPLIAEFFVEGRIPVDGWDTIDRKASSMSGEYHIDNASVVINDTDGLVRALLADVTTQWFVNREGAFKMLSESALAAGLTPRLLFGGRCYDVQLQDNRKARLEFEDVLSEYLDRTYPQYTIGDAYPFRFDDPYEIDETLNTDDPGLQVPIALRDQVIPIYYGPFVDSAVDPITGLPRGKGMVPTFFMGYTFLTAGTGTVPSEPSPELAVIMTGMEANWGGWGELLVCLGETDIPNVYASDLAGTGSPSTGKSSRILFASDRYGVDILAPGHPGWPFATDYVMRNGFRVTVIYARGPVLWQHITGIVNITVDVCGWKNADGDAVDQAGYVYQSFLSEHVLANDGAGYTSGPEAGLPVFADDGRAMIWTSKVQDWQAMTAARLGTAKGYLCSMALTEPTTLRQILATWHITFDAFSAKNAAGQLYPFSIDDLADVTDGVAIRERIELTDLPAPRIAWEEIENVIDYNVGWDPEQKTPRTTTLTIKDQGAIDALKGSRKGGIRKPSLRELKYTADDNTATDAIWRRLMRLKQPPRYQPLPLRTDAVEREIGEQVRVSHQDGIGPAGVGYLNRPMVVLEHAYRGNHITLVAFDVMRILESSASASVSPSSSASRSPSPSPSPSSSVSRSNSPSQSPSASVSASASLSLSPSASLSPSSSVSRSPSLSLSPSASSSPSASVSPTPSPSSSLSPSASFSPSASVSPTPSSSPSRSASASQSPSSSASSSASPSSGAPVTYEVIDVQQVAASAATSVQTPAFAANPATGDLILVSVASWASPATTHDAPTDTAGNTYVQIGTTLTQNTNNQLSLWACVNATGGSSFRVTSTTPASAYRAVVAWCVRPSVAIAYNGDVASYVGVSNSNDLDPITSPAPSDDSFFICIATRPNGDNTLTEGATWSPTGVNGFTSTMKTAAKYGLYSATVANYTEYKVSSAAEMGEWIDSVTAALRTVIVASFGPV